MSYGIESAELFKLLVEKEKNEGFRSTLSATVTKVVEQVKPILDRIPVLFEEYTLHDISHSKNVLDNMGKFIPADVKENLNASELYLLILSACLHDVGMAVSKDEEEAIRKSEDFLQFRDNHEREIGLIEKYRGESNIKAAEFYEKQIFMDFIRERHHKRSFDYIIAHHSGESGLKIDDETHARVVAKICRAHRLDVTDLVDPSEFDREYSLRGKFVNLQFLAVCLKLGDTLDADRRRAPKILKEFINPRDQASKEEWEKHLLVPEVGITEEKIKINATCRSPNYQRGLLEFVKKIENERGDFIKLLKGNPVDISDKYYLNLKEVQTNIETDGTYIYTNFKFSLDTEKILNLFMGTNLYTERTVALRELLQNSIDACRVRKAKEAGYDGNISFKLVKEHTDDGGIRKIVVEDNGIGMDDYVIEHYFMRIGKSYYQSRDFKKEGIPFSPISTFGIGILSCFMLTDRIEVETLKEGKDPIKLEIATDSEYFVTRKGSRRDPGTTITLFLKNDVEFDLIEQLKKYARHVEFPIYVDDGENKETIVDCGYDFNFVDYMNPLYKQYVNELNPYVIDFEKEGIEGVKGKVVFMFLRDEDGGHGFKSKFLVLRRYDSPFMETRFYGIERDQCILSQDGILIKNFVRYGHNSILPAWIDTSFIFFDVNLEGESKLDLTIDRGDVVSNDKLLNLQRKIEKIITNHIENILSDQHLVTSKSRFMEVFFRTFSESFWILSDFFIERMKKLLIFKCSIDGETKYLKFDELKHCRRYFYFQKEFRHNTPKDLKKAIEKVNHEVSIIYSVFDEKLPELLRIFSGEHIIVTNNESGFSFDKYLLVPSVEKRDKRREEYGVIFEGDYKDCFGTLTSASYQIVPNVNHQFMRLVNRNRDKFKGEDKKEHETFIEILLGMKTFDYYLKPLKDIQSVQRYLLDFYVEKGVLTREEAERYVLTEKDFCPYDMGEDFFK
jgi:HSP90 family molecular chaperone